MMNFYVCFLRLCHSGICYMFFRHWLITRDEDRDRYRRAKAFPFSPDIVVSSLEPLRSGFSVVANKVSVPSLSLLSSSLTILTRYAFSGLLEGKLA